MVQCIILMGWGDNKIVQVEVFYLFQMDLNKTNKYKNNGRNETWSFII